MSRERRAGVVFLDRHRIRPVLFKTLLDTAQELCGDLNPGGDVAVGHHLECAHHRIDGRRPVDHQVQPGLPALYQYRDQIKLYVSRHKQESAYLAYGYAKSTGRPAAYCVVPGPGVLNTTAALCTAHNAPVLCITGQVPGEFVGVGHGMLHELPDQLTTLRSPPRWKSRWMSRATGSRPPWG